MDPVSRRFMWEFLTETMANRAVILTTHSMEECEALCARIGILVLGELKCLGADSGGWRAEMRVLHVMIDFL